MISIDNIRGTNGATGLDGLTGRGTNEGIRGTRGGHLGTTGRRLQHGNGTTGLRRVLWACRGPVGTSEGRKELSSGPVGGLSEGAPRRGLSGACQKGHRDGALRGTSGHQRHQRDERKSTALVSNTFGPMADQLYLQHWAVIAQKSVDKKKTGK